MVETLACGILGFSVQFLHVYTHTLYTCIQVSSLYIPPLQHYDTQTLFYVLLLFPLSKNTTFPISEFRKLACFLESHVCPLDEYISMYPINLREHLSFIHIFYCRTIIINAVTNMLSYGTQI